jgi:hypothetical protein
MAETDYVAENARELERMRRIVEGLDEAGLAQPVNESWTVAGVLGHIAYWDGHALALADKLVAGVPFSPADEEPDDVDWANDASRAFLHAVPPAVAARAALQVAETIDQRVAGLPPERAALGWPLAEDSPLNLLRADHRGEHLDEIERALADGSRDA